MKLHSTAVQLKTEISVYPGDYGWKNPIYPFLSKNYINALRENGFEIKNGDVESRVEAHFFHITEGTLTLKKDNIEGELYLEELHNLQNTAPFCTYSLQVVAVAKDRTLEEFLDSLLILEKLPREFEIRYEKKGKNDSHFLVIEKLLNKFWARHITVGKSYYYKEKLSMSQIVRKSFFNKKTDEEICDAFELKEFLETGKSLFNDEIDAI